MSGFEVKCKAVAEAAQTLLLLSQMENWIRLREQTILHYLILRTFSC